MKKAIFLVFFTILGLFKPVFLGAMDGPSKPSQLDTETFIAIPLDNNQIQVISVLDGILLTQKLYELAKEKVTALDTIRRTKQLALLFISLTSGLPLKSTKNMQNMKTLLENQQCRAMLLQAHASYSVLTGECSEKTVYNFCKNGVALLKILKKFDHPLAIQLTEVFEASASVKDIDDKEDQLIKENPKIVLTRCMQKFILCKNDFKCKIYNDIESQISRLRSSIKNYENKKYSYLITYIECIEEKLLSAELTVSYYLNLNKVLKGNEYLADKTGVSFDKLCLGTPNYEIIIEKSMIKVEQETKATFLPKETLAFETRRKQNQKKNKSLSKNKRKKVRKRKKKRSKAASLPPIEKKQESVPTITSTTNIIKSPQAQLIQKLQSFYPGVVNIALFPHMVQFTDMITRRSFTLYNATGNTNYQDPAQFKQLAKLPKIHWRVSRWNKDIDTAIVQVQNETGKDIIGNVRKDWIRKHQLPAALLYHFRKMGHEKIFTDKDNNKITCLYFVGRLKDGKRYKKDGYFGLGFLPDAKKPTIYHACFEPKLFRTILAQDKELTAEQKKNLSLAFKSKDTSYD